MFRTNELQRYAFIWKTKKKWGKKSFLSKCVTNSHSKTRGV